MIKLNGVSLENFMEKFTRLEEKITEVNGKNNMLELMLEDANRLMKFYLTKEKSLIEEENERLKNDMADLKQQNERTVKDGEAEVQRLVSEMRAAGERHKRELETVRQQWRREVEEAHRQGLSQLEAKDTEVKKQLEEKDVDLEEMKKRLKEQERERQSELLKLQMEFGAKLARVQSTAQMSQQQQQQQQHGSHLLPQSVFKRKLQFFQEEKNKEIVALRQRIKELEENQRPCGFNDGRLKRRKI
ncbi:coiled-coil domain-containing protein 152-like isoform X2 [Dicentrarchus labrax]|uniref:coiled-coil domain-containing protein 152-like isoform X2 n=1 Tax=Dicentrarchus labrax TaxID=13489 RepID=UPI0021F641EC|nr:coiled-coil domain-containing protein 152-like isoform X2 [Dicentrarchus labrax]